MFKIGLRYFFSSLQRSRLKNVLRLTIISISINIGVLIAGISLIRGFERSALEKILHIFGHIRIFPYNELKNFKLKQKQIDVPIKIIRTNPKLQAFYFKMVDLLQIDQAKLPRLVKVIPKLDMQGIISKYNISEGVIIKGCTDEDAKFLLKNNMLRGEIKFNPASELRSVILGSRLAERLKVDVGDEVDLVIKSSDEEIQNVYCKVTGIFSFDFADADSTIIYTDSELIKQHRKNLIVGGNIYIDRIDKVDDFVRTLRSTNPSLLAEPWTAQNRAIKDMLDTSVRAIYLLIGLYILSGIIQGLSSLYVLLSERANDISVLTLLGMSRWQKYRIFVGYGFFVSMTNTFLGLLWGIALTKLYPYFRDFYHEFTGLDLIHKDMFWISDFNPELVLKDLFTICSTTFVIMSLSMMIAAYFISNNEIIKGIKE